jgi:hypothetical protein
MTKIAMAKFILSGLATAGLIMLALGISENTASLMMYGHRSWGGFTAVIVGAGLFVASLFLFIFTFAGKVKEDEEL